MPNYQGKKLYLDSAITSSLGPCFKRNFTPQSPSCSPSSWEEWKKRLSSENGEKIIVEYLNFLLILCYQFSSTIYQRVYTLFDLPFLVNTPIEALPVILCIPCQVQFHLHLGLSPPITTQPYFVSMYLPGSPILTSTVHAFSSSPLVWPAVSCLLFLISCSWGLLALEFCGRLP